MLEHRVGALNSNEGIPWRYAVCLIDEDLSLSSITALNLQTGSLKPVVMITAENPFEFLKDLSSPV